MATTPEGQVEEAPAKGLDPLPGTSPKTIVNDLILKGLREDAQSHRAEVPETVTEGGEPEGEAEEEEESILGDGEEELETGAPEPVEEPSEEAEGEDAGADAEEDQPKAEEGRDEKLDAYAANLRLKPQTWANIPTQLRGRAIARSLELAQAETQLEVVNAANEALLIMRDQAFQAGWQEAEKTAVAEADFQEIDEMDEADQGALARTDPARFRNYLDRKEGKQAIAEGRNVLPEAIGEILAKVRADPSAFALLEAKQKANPRIYQNTPEGQRNFARDAADALVVAATARVAAPKPTPATRKAQARETAAKARSPQRIDASRGNGTAAPKLPNDWKELVRMGVREDSKKYAR